MQNDLIALSRRLDPLQERLAERGFDELFVGGSASIGILDAVWEKKPLSLRDLDVYLIYGKQVSEAEARDLAAFLEGPEVGTLDHAGVTTHIRANPRLPASERYNYLAGWGMNFVKDGNVLDLTVYHSRAEIPLNGIFSSDTVKIRLEDMSLEEAVREIVRGTLDNLIERKIIRDEAGGYEDWRKREPRVIRWIEVERDPAVQALRVARGLIRYGLTTVPDDIREPFQKLAEDRKPHDKKRWATALKRLEQDGQAAIALPMVRAMGFGWLLGDK